MQHTKATPLPVQRKQLYSSLMHLVSKNDAFYFADYNSECGTGVYRIFNYRMCSYADWTNHAALDCRGTMFFVPNSGEATLVSRTPRKFFNYGENPFVMGISLENPRMVMNKEDGSIMSTYIDTNGELKLKSRGSISSEQAIDAMEWLDQPTQYDFKCELSDMTSVGYTVSMEWVAPQNQIVLQYPESGLIPFVIIENNTGYPVFKLTNKVQRQVYPQIHSRWVKEVDYDGDLEKFINESTGIEGVVVVTERGLMVKLKTPWYSALHRTKDSVRNAKDLIEVILNEGGDDLLGLFRNDVATSDRITKYMVHIGTAVNEYASFVDRAFAENNHLAQKDFAIQMKAKVNACFPPNVGWLFNVLMAKYNNKGDPFELIKGYILKNYNIYKLEGDTE